jgi:hypothetical protein
MTSQPRRLLFAVGLAIACWASVLAPSSAAQDASVPNAYEQNVTSGDGGGEPVVAVDPTNPQRVVAIDMQTAKDGFATGVLGPRCAVWSSDDGGDTWSGGDPLPITDTVNQSCEDPHMAAGPDGMLYAGGHAYGGLLLVVNHYRVVRSTDGGRSWSEFTELAANDRVDEDSSGAPRVDERPFRGWNFVDQSTGAVYENIPTPGAEGGYELYVSTDRGVTWNHEPRVGGSDATAGHGVIARLGAEPFFSTSTDQGVTWSADVPAPALGQLRADHSRPGRYAILDATTSFGTGAAHPVDVWVTEDSGATWSGPVELAESDATNAKRYMAWMDYGPTGALAVMWRTKYVDMDMFGGSGFHGVFDVWAAVSLDGGHVFATPLRLSSAMSGEPSPTSEFYGGYASPGGDDFSYLVLDRNNVHSVWGDWRTSPSDPSVVRRSMYYARVPLESAAAVSSGASAGPDSGQLPATGSLVPVLLGVLLVVAGLGLRRLAWRVNG